MENEQKLLKREFCKPNFYPKQIIIESYWKCILSTYFSDKKGGIEQIKIEIDTQLNYRIEIIPKLLKNRRIHEITDEVIEK